MSLPFAEAGLCCRDLPAVVQLRRDVADDDARSAVAAYGIDLVARRADRGPYIDDAKALLNQLSHAKAELDVAAWHTPCVYRVTAAILLAAQTFADEMTIPCTEWPTVDRMADVVLDRAKRVATVAQWRLLVRNANGAVGGGGSRPRV